MRAFGIPLNTVSSMPSSDTASNADEIRLAEPGGMTDGLPQPAGLVNQWSGATNLSAAAKERVSESHENSQEYTDLHAMIPDFQRLSFSKRVKVRRFELPRC